MIVFSSDWHLHPFKRFSTITEEGYNSRLWEQLEVITAVVDWANDHGAKYFILPGDIFHAQGEYLNKDVIRAGYVLLDRIKAELIILPGNHDIFRQKTVFRQFKDIAHVITTPTVMTLEDEDWAFVPFNRKFSDFQKGVETVKGADYLVCHQMFTGVKIGPEQFGFRLKDVFDSTGITSFRAVISGHCHKHQQLGNIWYVGSPLQMNFGDEGDDRGFMFYEQGLFTFMPVAGPRFETIELKTQEEADRFTESQTVSSYYRIILANGVRLDSDLLYNIEAHKEGNLVAEERVVTKNKTQEEIIKEALAVMYPDNDQDAMFEMAMDLWKEAE